MSVVGPTPDFDGFAAAQETLRSNFGRDVRFFAPAAMIYDPSIPASAFDDEGFPLDPLAGASAVASAQAPIDNMTVVGSAQCVVVFKPLQTSILRRDQTTETQLGVRSGLNKDLLLDRADYPQASGATHFMIGKFARDSDGNVISPEQWTPEDQEIWKIVNLKWDNFGPVERYIVYGQGTL